jgi:hypothetical protein
LSSDLQQEKVKVLLRIWKSGKMGWGRRVVETAQVGTNYPNGAQTMPRHRISALFALLKGFREYSRFSMTL